MPYDPLNADEPVAESFDRVSNRASKKQAAETKKKVQAVDDDEVPRPLLCSSQHPQPLMHKHSCTNIHLKPHLKFNQIRSYLQDDFELSLLDLFSG
jgi:hypothetical protein